MSEGDMIMDNGNGEDNWRVPVLFGATAIGLFCAARYLNSKNIPLPIDQQSEFKALSDDSAFDQQFEQFLSEHLDTINPPPSEYLDPITLHIMDDPVMLSDNQTYNRKTALYLLKYESISPITGVPLFDCVFESNEKLRNEIQGWIAALNLEYNQHFSINNKNNHIIFK